MSIFVYMFLGRGSGKGRGRGIGLPPAWGPDMERSYPFRTWVQDLVIWGIASSEMDPPQQCAQIITVLEGAARDLARNLSHDQLTTGGTLGGQQLDPVSYLLAILASHFAPLGEEARLRA